MPLTQVVRGGLSADAIDATKLADDSIDSEHIVDGSVDHAHLSTDCVDGDNIQDDAVDSEHINDGAIDLAHMSVNSVDSDQYVDGSIDHVHLSNDCVDGDNIAHGADLPNGVLAATQSSGDNTRKLATTAFVQTALGTVDVGQIETDQTFSANKTLTGSKNFLMAGDISLNSGVTLEVGANAKLIIVG